MYEVRPMVFDTRKIKRLKLIDGSRIEVSSVCKITRIDSYYETGKRLWFAVYGEGRVKSRINGDHVVSIVY